MISPILLQIVTASAGIALFVGLLIAGGSYAYSNRRGRQLRIPRFNFRYAHPGLPWSCSSMKGKDRPDLVFERRGIQLAVMGQASHSDYLPSSGEVASRRVSIVSEHSDSARVKRRESLVVDGREGVLIEVETVEQGKSVTYVGWSHGQRGFSYEMLLHGPTAKLKGDPFDVARPLFERFAFLDHEACSYHTLPPARLEWESKGFGYTFHPGENGWRQWTRIGHDFEEAEYGLFHDSGATLTFMPVLLPQDDLCLDAVCAGLLTLYRITYPDTTLVLQKSDESADARTYGFDRTVGENPYRYRLHVVRWGRVAALITLCSEPDNPRIEEVFDHVVRDTRPPTEGALPDIGSLQGGARKRQAQVMHGIGRWLSQNRQYESSAVVYAQSLELAPDHQEALNQALLARVYQEDYDAAFDLLNKHLSRFRGNLQIRSFEPFLLGRLGQPEKAVERYEELFGEGYQDRHDFEDYIELLCRTDRRPDAILRAEELAEQSLESWAHRMLARLHRESGDNDAAIAHLRPLSDREPIDVDIHVALAHEYNYAERHNDALTVCERLEERGFNGADVCFAQGIAEFGLHWYKNARRSFEKSLKEAPTNEHIKGWLEHVTTQLGEGSHRMVSRPIDPVALPEDLLEGTPPVPAEGGTDGAGAVHLDRIRVFHYEKGKQLKATSVHRIAVMTPRAVERLSTFMFRFNPEHEELFVNELRVRDASGETVSVARVEDMYVQDDPDTTGADNRKVLHVPVSGLAPGHLLEVTCTRCELGTPTAFPYKRMVLVDEYPILRNVVQIVGDAKDVHVEERGDVEVREGDGFRRWTVRDTPAVTREPLQIPPEQWLPVIRMAERQASWDEVVKDYLESASERLAEIEPVRATALQVTEGLEDDEEKTAALCRFVQREITYRAISFGPRAYLPPTAESVLEDRFSDCKGHSTLLYQLMRSIDLPCKLALIHTEDELWEDLPSRMQFNHMINYCPGYRGGVFIDCTDKELNLSRSTPTSLVGQKALILDEDDPRILAVPGFAPDDNLVEITREIRCDASGDLEVKETLTAHRNLGGYLRGWMKHPEPSERAEFFERQLQAANRGIELLEMTAETVDDSSQPMIIHSRYIVRDALHEVEDRFVGRLPVPWERDYLVPDKVDSRVSPFRVRMPVRVRSEVRVHPPEGFHCPTLGAFEGHGTKGPFTRWFCRASAGQSGETSFRVEFDCRWMEGRHPASQYAEFRDGMVTAVDTLRAKVVMVPFDPSAH